jgi:hypothetical protein
MSRIPWAWLTVIAVLAAALLWQRERTARAQLDLAEYRQTQAETARLVERSRRATEQRWAEKTEGAAADGQKKLDLVRADAGRTRNLANRVQRQLADLRAAVRRAAEDSGLAAAGPSAGAAAGVCAELLSRAAARAAVVERFADEAHAAGGTCERVADGLTQD